MNQKAAQPQVDSLCYHDVGKPSCFLWHSVLYVTRVYDTLEPFKMWILEVQDVCVRYWQQAERDWKLCACLRLKKFTSVTTNNANAIPGYG